MSRGALLGLFAGLWAAVATAACAAAGGGALVLERTIPLPGVTGRIDHLAVDLERHRLFVAEVGAGALDQIDLATGQRLKRVVGLKEPQGVAYLPDMDQVVVANGGDGSVRFYRAEGLEPVGEVRLDGDADNVRIELKRGLVVVAYGSGLALIDPAGRTIVGDIPLRSHPEGFQIDQATQRAYVNMPGQRRVVVVDLAARREVASWATPGAIWNFPLALTPAGTVAAVFRGPPKLMMFDAKSGAVTARSGVCGDSDDAHFDLRRRRLYVTCGTGAVETFAEAGGSYRSLGRTGTRSGARTALFVPELDRLFVAARAGGGGQAAIMVLRPQD
ncbi:MAG TPA: hypothetical protein VL460_01920 [Caulobacteraceae bacterium]|jgi:hypothetical protein|nr:hypothetical protein [Caulobacteraceae bacterium]